jgi:hypothetical protein
LVIYNYLLPLHMYIILLSVLRWRKKNLKIRSQGSSHLQKIGRFDFSLREHEGEVNEYTSPWTGFELTTLVVIGTDCKGS